MSEASNPLKFGLRNVLNRHGYGFQYAVLRKCLENSLWRSAVTEYPFELNKVSIHADFILGFHTHLLVAECKRVDGWRWGFARSNAELRGSWANRPRGDFLTWTNAQPPQLQRRAKTFGGWVRQPYDINVEIKDKRPKDGESDATSRAFETAIAQVLRARSGLIDELRLHARMIRYGGGAVVPVVFTNATLVVTEAELSIADLETGRLPDIDETVEDNYIWYDHNLSSSLRPQTPLLQIATDAVTKTQALRSTLDRELTKSIAIVRPTGIEQFLSNLATLLEQGSDPI